MQLQTEKDIFIHRLQHPLFIFTLFSAISLFLYRNTIGCRLVTDALNWLQQYQIQGFAGITHSFGDISQHYSYHLLFYGLYRLFGFHETGYYIVFTLLHALNATLLFVVIKQYLQLLAESHAKPIALFASILFLLQPYQTETVVWGATIHYLALTCIFLLLLKLHLQLSVKANVKSSVAVALLLIFALFLHLISITFPVIIALLIYPICNFSFKKTWQQVWPMLAITVLFILSNYFVVGSATGHKADYTASGITLPTFISNAWNYVFKDFFLMQFAPYNIRDFVYTHTANIGFMIAAIIMAGLCIFYYRFQRNRKTAYQTIATFAIAFLIALAPALPLYFYYLTSIEADRFTYFPLIFSSSIISIMIYQLHAYLRWGIMLFLIAVSIFFLQKNISAWSDAAQLQTAMENNFPVNTQGNMYLLNIPDNMRGAYLYREEHNASKLAESIDLKQQINIGPVYEVMQFNMQKPGDGVIVEIMDSITLQMRFAQYGNWWWMEGKGAVPYSDSLVQVAIAPDGMSYTVQFKHKAPGDTFVYLKDMQWHTLNNF